MKSPVPVALDFNEYLFILLRLRWIYWFFPRQFAGRLRAIVHNKFVVGRMTSMFTCFNDHRAAAG